MEQIKKISCGILFIFDNKVLLCHSTGSTWRGSSSIYIPPKGGIEENETQEECASREAIEEVGITILPSRLKNCRVIKISGAKENYLFVLKLNSLSEIGLKDLVLPKLKLQLKEIDYAKFYTKEEASKLLRGNWVKILDELK